MGRIRAERQLCEEVAVRVERGARKYYREREASPSQTLSLSLSLSQSLMLLSCTLFCFSHTQRQQWRLPFPHISNAFVSFSLNNKFQRRRDRSRSALGISREGWIFIFPFIALRGVVERAFFPEN